MALTRVLEIMPRLHSLSVMAAAPLPSLLTGLLLASLLAGCRPETLTEQDFLRFGVVVGADVQSGDVAAPADTGGDAADSATPDIGGKCTTDAQCPASANCLVWHCQADGSCKDAPADDNTPCDDGSACTAGDLCAAHVCVGTAKDCNDDNPCTTDGCDAVSAACQHAPVNGACDDGDPCTLNDHCSVGACSGDKNSKCLCTKDSDCTDDGNLCNGKMFCDKTAGGSSCKPNPATKIVCPTVDDTGCTKNACEAKTGKCLLLPIGKTKLVCTGEPKECYTETSSILAKNIACDDGNACTSSDQCSDDGLCTSGTVVCECQKNDDCLKKENGNACDGTLYCDLSQNKCVLNPATIVTCPAANDTVCATSTCDVSTGACSMKPVFGVKKPCDDGNQCTDGDFCDNGTCKSSANICTCATDDDCKSKEDGDFCNGTMFCNLGLSPHTCQVNPATVVSCPSVDDTQCTRAVCDPNSGKCATLPVELTTKKISDCKENCAYQPLAKDVTPVLQLCDDGNACTASEQCKGGSCSATAYVCSCAKDSDCKDDGNLCNGVPYCLLSLQKCITNPATVVECPTGNDTQCARTLCEPKSGKCLTLPVEKTFKQAPKCDPSVSKCTYLPVLEGAPAQSATLCDDGNICTKNDVCASGVCLAGGTNTCTCGKDADCAAKEDGNACNGTMFCDLEAEPHDCKVNPATVVTCANVSDTACSRNVCDKTTGTCGIKFINENGLCSDGTNCTKSDVCALGECKPGTNICVCQKDGDCANKEDGNFCNGTLYCDVINNACVLNPATVVTCPTAGDTQCSKNFCDTKDGVCKPTQLLDGVPCDDGNPCTPFDFCLTGACASGTANYCECQQDIDCSAKDDSNLCNGTLVCDKAAAPFQCKTNPATVIKCQDGGVCLAGVCDAATGTCQKQAVAANCDDGNACTVDTCEGKFGTCSHATQIDGTPCAPGKQCKGLQCLAP